MRKFDDAHVARLAVEQPLGKAQWHVRLVPAGTELVDCGTERERLAHSARTVEFSGR